MMLSAVLLLLGCANSFIPPVTRAPFRSIHRHVGYGKSVLIPELRAVDPTQVVDPVVVSGAFWATLRAKLLGALIANVVAGTVIAGAGSLFAGFVARKGLETVSKVGDQKRKEPELPKESVELPTIDGEAWIALAVSLAIDLAGDASYALPFLGDATDVVFGPLEGFFLYNLYGSTAVAALGLAEELLPGFDFLPTATIAWALKYLVKDDSPIKKAAGMSKGATIDVE